MEGKSRGTRARGNTEKTWRAARPWGWLRDNAQPGPSGPATVVAPRRVLEACTTGRLCGDRLGHAIAERAALHNPVAYGRPLAIRLCTAACPLGGDTPALHGRCRTARQAASAC